MNELRQRFGRPLRLGIIGGGPGVWIGETHRTAAELDGWWRVTAGVFSSDPARSRAAGPQVGVAAERSYGDVAEMLAKEKQRPDGIDAVAIMGPNDTHYAHAALALDAGLDVIGDKPVTNTFKEACDLVARAQAKGRLFAVAHGYAAYPMTRHARGSCARGRSATCGSCRSSTSRAGSRRSSKMLRRTTGCAGCSIRSAAASRW